MMFLVFFFINELRAFVPHWKIIRVDPTSVGSSSCESGSESNQIIKDKCKKYPKEYGGKDECNRLMKPYAGFSCYTGDGDSAVNTALSKVDSSIELLFVEIGLPNQKVDFNNLPSQMMVVLYYDPYEINSIPLPDLMIKTNFDANLAGFRRLLSHIPKESADIQIVGNISNKVTYLSITYQTFQIVDSDLNIDTIVFDTSTFDPNSPYKIKSNFVLSHISNLLPETLTKSINHYGYFDDDPKTDNYEIKFNLDVIHVKENVYNTSYEIKYYFDKLIDIILYATKITFSFSDDFANIDNKVLKLNLTLTNFHPSRRPSDDIKGGNWVSKNILLEKDSLVINVDGDWSKIKQKPEIIINYNKDMLIVDTSELKKVAFVNETELFNFKSSWKDKKKKNIGLIVGVTVGCVAAVAIIVVVVILVLRHNNKIGVSAAEN